MTGQKARGNNGGRSCHHCHPRAHVRPCNQRRPPPPRALSLARGARRTAACPTNGNAVPPNAASPSAAMQWPGSRAGSRGRSAQAGRPTGTQCRLMRHHHLPPCNGLARARGPGAAAPRQADQRERSAGICAMRPGRQAAPARASRHPEPQLRRPQRSERDLRGPSSGAPLRHPERGPVSGRVEGPRAVRRA